MNALTKSVVILSTLLAAVLEIYLAAPGFPAIINLALAGLAVAVIAGLWARPIVVGVVLVAAYVTPAALLNWAGSSHFSFEMAWVAPMVGVLVIGRRAWQWSLPRPWQLPLVAGALVVSVTWPIVALREVAFRPWMLFENAANTSVGISPWDVLSWSVYLALGFNVGVLWFDALFRWYGEAADRKAFSRQVLLPMASAAALACVVGTYQGLVDLNFLNGHLWPHMRRASGTFMDANVFGTIAALWAPAFALAALWQLGRWSPAIAGSGLALSFLGVWTSGSRTALAAWTVGVLVLLHQGWKAWQAHGSRYSRRAVIAGAVIGLVAALGLGLLVARGSATATVFARIPSLIPGMEEGATVSSSLWQLWDRFGYGTAAVGMIREHPLEGVGVGSFHTLVHDYATVYGQRQIPPDNAQNWFRHVLAELGVVGAGPWLLWALVFLGALLRMQPADAASAGVLRGVLLALGAISLLSMPSQSMPVTLTFWTFAFWFVWASGRLHAGDAPGTAWSWKTWAAVLAVVVVHAGLTLASARGDLNPLNRAMRFGWDYRAGITALEPTADGSPGRRWTREHGLTLVPVGGRVLKFVAWTGHPEANEQPVPVKVWADSKLVFEGAIKKEDAFYVDIPAVDGQKFIVLETWIGRTFRPSDYGHKDRRVLGLAIQDWTWATDNATEQSHR